MLEIVFFKIPCSKHLLISRLETLRGRRWEEAKQLRSTEGALVKPWGTNWCSTGNNLVELRRSANQHSDFDTKLKFPNGSSKFWMGKCVFCLFPEGFHKLFCGTVWIGLLVVLVLKPQQKRTLKFGRKKLLGLGETSQPSQRNNSRNSLVHLEPFRINDSDAWESTSSDKLSQPALV